MKLQAQVFPRFSRFFAAFSFLRSLTSRLFWLLILGIPWLLLAALLAGSLVERPTVTDVAPVLAKPFAILPHINLLKKLRTTGLTSWIQQETEVIKWLSTQEEMRNKQQKVLAGRDEEAEGYLETLTSSSVQRASRIVYWEKIIQTKPNYRDGYIQLAALYLQEGNLEKAKAMVVKAKNIDPLSSGVVELEKILE